MPRAPIVRWPTQRMARTDSMLLDGQRALDAARQSSRKAADVPALTEPDDYPEDSSTALEPHKDSQLLLGPEEPDTLRSSGVIDTAESAGAPSSEALASGLADDSSLALEPRKGSHFLLAPEEPEEPNTLRPSGAVGSAEIAGEPSPEAPPIAFGLSTNDDAPEQTGAPAHQITAYTLKDERAVGGNGRSWEEQLAHEEARVAAAGEPLQAATVGSPSGKGMGSALSLLKSKRSPQQKNAKDPSVSSPTRGPSALTIIQGVLRLRRLTLLGGTGTARVAPDVTAAATSLHRRTAPASVDEAVALMSAVGKDSRGRSEDDDWEGRNLAILSLPSLLEPLAVQAERWKEALPPLGKALSTSLADLRSAIVRSACDVLRELAAAHRAALAPLVTAVLPQLLQNLALLKAFSTASATAATVLVGLAPSNAALRVLVEQSKDPKKQVRQGSLELIGVLLGCAPTFVVAPKGLAAALGAIGTSGSAGHGITDPDGGCRNAAARTFWVAQRSYPGEQVDRWLGELGVKETKLVERHKPVPG